MWSWASVVVIHGAKRQESNERHKISFLLRSYFWKCSEFIGNKGKHRTFYNEANNVSISYGQRYHKCRCCWVWSRAISRAAGPGYDMDISMFPVLTPPPPGYRKNGRVLFRKYRYIQHIHLFDFPGCLQLVSGCHRLSQKTQCA